MQRLSRDTVAAGGRHAEAEEVHAEEEVHHEDRQEERASEGARAHGASLGGLSGADHQIPAGRRPRPHVIGVGSGREIAAALLEPVQPIRARSCVSLRSYVSGRRMSLLRSALDALWVRVFRPCWRHVRPCHGQLTIGF